MDKITYNSTKALLDPGRFAVGILIDNELHLNPLHGILHVKPSFPYLDKSDKAIKDSGVDPGGKFIPVLKVLTLLFSTVFFPQSRVMRKKLPNKLP